MMFDRKHNEEKKRNGFAVLDYNTAYERLRKWIDKYYWKLDPVELDFLDQALKNDPEVLASQIDFFMPKKKGAFNGSGAVGEKRLQLFLKELYMEQAITPKSEGCLPILRTVEKIITDSTGHHFPGRLADAVRKKVLDAVRLEPGERTVVLQGRSATEAAGLMERLKPEAEKRCDNYFSRDDNTSNDFSSSYVPWP